MFGYEYKVPGSKIAREYCAMQWKNHKILGDLVDFCALRYGNGDLMAVVANTEKNFAQMLTYCRLAQLP